ncbi:MAG: hypothetical protein MZU97_17780 [Bacillus subtilis]|nr:hypothetical protein [Bacillus subtilis]
MYDLIHYEGGSVANYLEFGGPNYKKAVKAMEICLKVPSKVILIVTFGTIARADVMAQESSTPSRNFIRIVPSSLAFAAPTSKKRLRFCAAPDSNRSLIPEEAVRTACQIARRAGQ